VENRRRDFHFRHGGGVMHAITPTGTDTATATDFITQWFGATEAPVYLSSLPNTKNDPNEQPERFIATRDSAQVISFIEKWDRPARGLFFCVSTIREGTKRNKDNVAEIPGLWADVDFKDVVDDEATILRRVKALPKPPSIIVRSGNGLHMYWRFKESLIINIIDGPDIIERVEENLKLLADLVGGDQKVTQVSALMRMPGTHNSKNGNWKPVEIESNTGHEFELDDIEDEMLSIKSPVVLRKVRPSQNRDSNSFSDYAAAAAELGFKQPLDVQNRLEQMTYMGGEDSSIHGTQVVVTASLLSSGVGIDEVVSFVLKATEAAVVGYGERWNWKREEKTIRGMCATWLKKHPQERAAPRIIGGTDGGNGAAATVHKLDDARKAKPAKTLAQLQAVIDKANMHVMIGTLLIKSWQDRNTPIMIVVDQLWRYIDGMWCAPESKGRQTIDAEIETIICGLKETSTLKLVNETRGWIYRNATVFRDAVEWDDHGKIAVKGGLIDPTTLVFEPAKPEHHVTARIDCEFDAAAQCPVWLEMLDATFADRNEIERGNTIVLVQDMLGMALIEEKSKALSRALIFHGISNTGKTDLIKTISGLLTDNPIATPIGALDGTHGLMEFCRKAPWVLHEAFKSGVWHFSDIVKSILSGDPVQINVKNSALTTQRIRQPIFWGTNYPPQFKEATKAIVNRMVVIHCRREFREGAPLVGAAAEARRRGFTKPSELILSAELQGLLNWAIAGLQRALGRGSIALTDSIKETADDIRRDANLVAGFLEECVEYDPMARLKVTDFCLAHAAWFIETKGEDRRLPSNDAIGKALSAMADPRIAINPKELRDTTSRYYGGIALSKAGLRYHRTGYESRIFEGKVGNATAPDREVNSLIPASWDAKPSIVALRERIERLDKVSSPPSVIDDQVSLPHDTDEVSS
jgi:hypothetical protein